MQGSKLKGARGTLNVLRAHKNTGMLVLLAPKKTAILLVTETHELSQPIWNKCYLDDVFCGFRTVQIFYVQTFNSRQNE